ncbi:hypothetical protein [Clostridium chrysemydis]|uniref:hypothetical protein n=1 Tax=Clostridium chrysemydis TaxID=2665504 RepID=UPI0018834E17|nr:hypothetical protein [Clostridium chrysemydis]
MSLPDSCYDYRYQREKQREIDECSECGCSIYEGEEYYDISNLIICCDCIQRFKKEAEVE